MGLPEPYYARDGITLYVGDNRDVLPALDVAVSAVVTDPPYGLSFMGKDWDHEVPGVAFWEAMERVMKPGAHLVAFAGTRTQHRMGVAIEDAGFEIRDTLMWLYGSGFPKSLDVSKAIDKAAGAEREVVGRRVRLGDNKDYDTTRSGGTWEGNTGLVDTGNITAPATPEAEQWQGWGTALKPSFEPIILARKPLAGTVAANVLTHGTGALNIDGTRIGGEPWKAHDATGLASTKFFTDGEAKVIHKEPHSAGRWPANVILDEDAAAALDAQSGERATSKPGHVHRQKRHTTGSMAGSLGEPMGRPEVAYGDTGGASRFFYVAKASRRERNAGMSEGESNGHPTVKPLALMRWLITLVTPPGGIALDPFAGSGSTLVAAAALGVNAVGIELSEEYAEIAARRIDHALNERAGKLPLEVA